MGFLFSNLLLESIFYFGEWSNRKYTNTRDCIFSVWPLSIVKNWFQKQIWKQNAHISILIFFVKSFGQYLRKSKNGFPIAFSKTVFHLCIGFSWESNINHSSTPAYSLCDRTNYLSSNFADIHQAIKAGWPSYCNHFLLESGVMYCSAPCTTVKHCTMCSTTLYTVHCTVHYNVVHSAQQRCALHCTALHCTVQQFSALNGRLWIVFSRAFICNYRQCWKTDTWPIS